MELSITDNAIKRFKANLSGNPDALGLRISIKPTGCNGYSYVLDYVSDISRDDQVMTFSDVSVYVDNKSMELIDGTEIDFIEEGFNQVLSFQIQTLQGNVVVEKASASNQKRIGQWKEHYQLLSQMA